MVVVLAGGLSDSTTLDETSKSKHARFDDGGVVGGGTNVAWDHSDTEQSQSRTSSDSGVGRGVGGCRGSAIRDPSIRGRNSCISFGGGRGGVAAPPQIELAQPNMTPPNAARPSSAPPDGNSSRSSSPSFGSRSSASPGGRRSESRHTDGRHTDTTASFKSKLRSNVVLERSGAMVGFPDPLTVAPASACSCTASMRTEVLVFERHVLARALTTFCKADEMHLVCKDIEDEYNKLMKRLKARERESHTVRDRHEAEQHDKAEAATDAGKRTQSQFRDGLHNADNLARLEERVGGLEARVEQAVSDAKQLRHALEVTVAPVAKLIFAKYGHQYGHGRTLHSSGLHVQLRRQGLGGAAQMLHAQGAPPRQRSGGVQASCGVGTGLPGGLDAAELAALLEEEEAEQPTAEEEAAMTAAEEKSDAAALAALVLAEDEHGKEKPKEQSKYEKAQKAENDRNQKSKHVSNRNVFGADHDDTLEETAAIGTMLM